MIPCAEGSCNRAGDQFLYLISFLGCSPYVEFEPAEPDSDKFCHVRIPPPSSAIQFVAGGRNVTVYCRRCRYRENNWQTLIRDWQSNPRRYQFQCPECGAKSSPLELNWRKTAGFSRQYIEIINISPHEAVPSGLLLNTLEKISGSNWTYFYAQ